MLRAVRRVVAAIAHKPCRRGHETAAARAYIRLGAEEENRDIRPAAGIHHIRRGIERPRARAEHGFVRSADHTRRSRIDDANGLSANTRRTTAIDHLPDLLGFREARGGRSVRRRAEDRERVVGAAAAGVEDAGRVKSPGRGAFDIFVRANQRNAVLCRRAITNPGQQRNQTETQQFFHELPFI